MSDLITIPHFQFPQGDAFGSGQDQPPYPIDVLYYDNCIAIEQHGNEILLSYEHAATFWAELLRHLPAAKAIHLKREAESKE